MPADLGGLFDSAPAAAQPVASGAEPKRTKLKRWDHAAVQCLNPQGVSDVDEASLKDLWKALAAGNKAVAFHSNLASTEVYRCGVGWSQTAESILAAMTDFKSNPNIKGILKSEVWQKVIVEIAALEPHLQVLNVGKGGEFRREQGQGFGGLRKRHKVDAEAVPTPENIKLATTAVVAWLRREQSPFRGVLSIMSKGGVYYQANVSEKVARACIAHRQDAAEMIGPAVTARLHAAASGVDDKAEAAPDDAAGLFAGAA